MTNIERYRNTWAEINVSAIGYNIQQLMNLLPETSKMMAVVKMNGYGHGSVEVAKVAVKQGVDHLMVALLEEAVYLRNHGIDVPILVIGMVDPNFAPIAAEKNITLTVFQLEWLTMVQWDKVTSSLAIHLELETGMGRTGIHSDEELIAIIDKVHELNKVQITGIYTHFATADEIASTYYKEQQRKFSQMLTVFQKHYQEPIIIHTGNSAAGIQFSGDMQHYTRFGIAIYGLYPSEHIKRLNIVQLKEAFSLHSELIQVKKVQKGQSISYGRTYKTEEDEWIGTIPIGYGDGWRRALQGFYVLVEGKKMPIVGRICMDLTMVKLDKNYPVGTKVTLIGKDGEEEIRVDDVANFLQTINYEITCMLTDRIPRIYRE